MDDASMFDDMVNDREDEETFMKFFRLFEGSSVEEVAACKEVRMSGSQLRVSGFYHSTL